MSDTIAAIATGGGVSAIGIIRLSGDSAIDITSRVFRPKNGQSMHDAKSRTLYYGELLNKDGEPIDLCLCTVSRAPDSYTGEDTAELHCHGSPIVLAEGLRALFAAGARQALPGEFTKRAFLNGKLDLSQAAAVIDLIDAETETAAKNALGQLGGAMGKRIDAVYSALLDISSHYFAVIDYPDEDIEDFELRQYEAALGEAAETLRRLLATFERGRVWKEGVLTAIIGRPNVGKSSLLNALAGFDRAIVSPVAGTTRDTIEEKVRVGSVVLRLTDTAGLRKTSDEIESLGVARSKTAAEAASLVLAVFDGSEPLDDADGEVLDAAAEAGRCIAVVSKSDLPLRADTALIEARLGKPIFLSAHTGEGLDTLHNAVEALFGAGELRPNGEVLTNAYQADAVSRAIEYLSEAISSLKRGMTPDAVLSDIEAALTALGEITGRTIREDTVTRIFERFCVGK
jgi:tRNA modification GTPase